MLLKGQFLRIEHRHGSIRGSNLEAPSGLEQRIFECALAYLKSVLFKNLLFRANIFRAFSDIELRWRQLLCSVREQEFFFHVADF